MPTRDEYLKRPLAERLQALRPAPEGPAGAPRRATDAERWAEARKYPRNDPHEALTAFGRRRREVLALLGGLSAEQWRRGGIHPEHGRFSFEAWIAGMAGHDDNHLDQLRRAAHGSPFPYQP